ncbi:MAG: hypothetical protein N3F07_03345 [Candidatus Micrarchaeota archaeon]|nr:hypothetical protein [Candidatus Micrarchaeota archaeon]
MWYYRKEGGERHLPFPSPQAERKKRSLFYSKMLEWTAAELKRMENSKQGKVSEFFDKLAEKELARAERKRSQESFLWKASGKIAKATGKLMEAKRKMLKKIGMDEQQIIDTLGEKNAFRLAKFGSRIDIYNEALSILIFAGGAAGIVAVAASSIKNGIADMQEMSKAFNTFLTYAIYTLVAIAPITRAMTWIGNTLDVLQHILMDTIASRLEGKAREAVEKEHDAFKRESIREAVVDVAIGLIPIPLIDILRRVRAIKLELRQLGHIARMEKIYFEGKEKQELGEEQ